MDDNNNASNASNSGNTGDAKQQLVDKLKTSNNILVTVSRNPSVDQLASCIGLTLLLNKQGKHAAAVFSGTVPSTIEFLQPEETLEKTTDSLRDFIIALDKSKADKLRYKVEDNVVRIFITPYRTSISEADLEFTQGDFNVDVVVALGVQLQEDLDQAITAHGRILHDATLTSISTSGETGLGTINWHDPQASSLSELVADLAQALDGKLLDNQIATALLTGIVAETDRFSNDRTSSRTMSASALLMAAGANQQLIATKLEEAAEIPLSIQNRGDASSGQSGQSAPANSANSDDSTDAASGVMEISHDTIDVGSSGSADSTSNAGEAAKTGDSADGFFKTDQASAASGTAASETHATPAADRHLLSAAPEIPGGADQQPAAGASGISPGEHMVTEPPTMGGVLTANSQREGLDPATDPFRISGSQPPQLVENAAESWLATPPSSATGTNDTSAPSPAPAPAQSVPATPAPLAAVSSPTPAPAATSSDSSNTLAALEASVQSPHLDPGNLDAARDEVSRALSSTSAPETDHPEAIQALNAQPMGSALHGPGSVSSSTVSPLPSSPQPQSSTTTPTLTPTPTPAPQTPTPANDFSTNPGPTLDDILGQPAAGPQVIDSTAPPPVPPPIPFQFGSPPS